MDLTYPDRYYKAVEYVEKTFGDLEANPDLDNVHKLVFYALRKQIDAGPCSEPAPYMWNVRERYKHAAWTQLKTMSKFEAMVHYVQHLEELKGANWIADVMPSSSEKAPSAHEADAEAWLASTTDPTPENIAALQNEVRRLRHLLKENGILDKSTAERGSAAASTDGALVADTEQRPAAPMDDVVIPPLRPLAPPLSVDLPSKHNALLADGSLSMKPVPTAAQTGSTASEVYYTPKKLSWLEWLGVISVEEDR